MRLAEFIIRDMEVILREWEAFAATQLPAAETMTALALRDHARQILETVARDLSTSQTKKVQDEKSKGNATVVAGAPDTAAETHAELRAESGFDIRQLVAEYRALRASVLRLWMDASRPEVRDLEDVIRLNEAIDQAIAESIASFSAQVDQSRNLLLGMIGHDMRSPVNTIMTLASYLHTLESGPQVKAAASRLSRSGIALKALLDDLVDYNRSKLGLGIIEIALEDIDMAEVCADEVDQMRVAHPGRRLDLNASGDTRGRWDGARLQRLMRNLVSNALTHGTPHTPVRVRVTGLPTDVQIEVANSGPTIERATLERIFAPLVRGPLAQQSPNPEGSLGLGLFIVREVAHAHGGEVGVRSEAGETVFSVRLPRQNGPAQVEERPGERAKDPLPLEASDLRSRSS